MLIFLYPFLNATSVSQNFGVSEHSKSQKFDLLNLACLNLDINGTSLSSSI
jgi:hypothetical protein